MKRRIVLGTGVAGYMFENQLIGVFPDGGGGAKKLRMLPKHGKFYPRIRLEAVILPEPKSRRPKK